MREAERDYDHYHELNEHHYKHIYLDDIRTGMASVFSRNLMEADQFFPSPVPEWRQ